MTHKNPRIFKTLSNAMVWYALTMVWYAFEMETEMVCIGSGNGMH